MSDVKLQPNAERTGLAAQIDTSTGLEYSLITTARAREVAGELRALSERYVADGPTVVGWAVEWIAADIEDALAKLAQETTPEGGADDDGSTPDDSPA